MLWVIWAIVAFTLLLCVYPVHAPVVALYNLQMPTTQAPYNTAKREFEWTQILPSDKIYFNKTVIYFIIIKLLLLLLLL